MVCHVKWEDTLPPSLGGAVYDTRLWALQVVVWLQGTLDVR